MIAYALAELATANPRVDASELTVSNALRFNFENLLRLQLSSIWRSVCRLDNAALPLNYRTLSDFGQDETHAQRPSYFAHADASPLPHGCSFVPQDVVLAASSICTRTGMRCALLIHYNEAMRSFLLRTRSGCCGQALMTCSRTHSCAFGAP